MASYTLDWTPDDEPYPIDKDWATRIQDAIDETQKHITELEAMDDEDIEVGKDVMVGKRLAKSWHALEAHIKDLRADLDVTEFTRWPLHSDAVHACLEACAMLAAIEMPPSEMPAAS